MTDRLFALIIFATIALIASAFVVAGHLSNERDVRVTCIRRHGDIVFDGAFATCRMEGRP